MSKFLSFRNIAILLVILTVLYLTGLLGTIVVAVSAFLLGLIGVLGTMLSSIFYSLILGLICITIFRLVTKKSAFPSFSGKLETLKYLGVAVITGIVVSYIFKSLLSTL